MWRVGPCLVLVLTLAGCGRFGFATGTGDAPVGAAADGNSPAGDAPAMVCVAPVGNDDDEDGIDDACDGCPHLADGAQVDGDGDGVGDVCDRSPGDDRVVRFDPFLSAALEERWSVVLGAWTVAASQARLDGAGGGLGRLGHAHAGGPIVAVARGAVVATGAGAPVQLSIQLGQSGNEEADYCEVYGDPNQPRLKASVYDGVGFIERAAILLPALTPGPFALALIDDGAAGWRCQFVRPSGASEISSATPVAAGRDLLYLQFAEVTVELASYGEVVPAP
ncbi:MAG: hypothetical protein KBG28_17105 [Kofleriaceae bacterium]|nr:hypothetical protein [Kofleriaceae bacterium]